MTRGPLLLVTAPYPHANGPLQPACRPPGMAFRTLFHPQALELLPAFEVLPKFGDLEPGTLVDLGSVVVPRE